jgi:hypothetical protein
MEPETMEPETMEPEPMEPATMEPATMDPETLEPKTMEPETMEPEPMEPMGEGRTQYDSEGRDISWRWTRGISSRPSGEQTAHHSSVPPSGASGTVPEAPSLGESDRESGNKPEGPSQIGEERGGKSRVGPDVPQVLSEDDMGEETGNEPEVQCLPFDKDKGGTGKNGSGKDLLSQIGEDRVESSRDMPDSEPPIRHDLALMSPLEVSKSKFPTSARRHSKSPRKALQNNSEKRSPNKGDGWYNRSTYGCNRCSVTTSTRRGMELHMWKAGLRFRFYFLRLSMDKITKKTPSPKCRLYWCLIEFIDWRYSQSCCYCRPLW